MISVTFIILSGSWFPRPASHRFSFAQITFNLLCIVYCCSSLHCRSVVCIVTFLFSCFVALGLRCYFRLT
jgi:hypothetical protein